MTKKSGLIEAFDALLDRESKALLAGDLQSIPGILTEKEALFERLKSGRPNPEGLAALRAKAARNAGLISGALEGIRAVSLRLKIIRKVKAGMETYDQAGRRSVLSGKPGSKMEKRA